MKKDNEKDKINELKKEIESKENDLGLSVKDFNNCFDYIVPYSLQKKALFLCKESKFLS